MRPPKSRDMKYNRAIRAHVFFRELLFRTSHSHSLTRSPATNKSAARPLHPRTRRRRAAQPSSLFRIRSLYRGATKGGRPRSLFALIVYPSFRLRGQVDSQCKSCLVTDNFPQQICQGNIKTERNNRITLMHIQEMGSSQFGGKNIETVHAKLNIDIRICELKLEDAKPSKRE